MDGATLLESMDDVELS